MKRYDVAFDEEDGALVIEAQAGKYILYDDYAVVIKECLSMLGKLIYTDGVIAKDDLDEIRSFANKFLS